MTRAAAMTGSDPAADADDRPAALLRRGRILEAITLAWNVAGIIVLTFAAIGARSVALAGFGLDSLIEIGASIVVLWELSGTGEDRQRRGLRLIGGAFLLLAAYLTAQSAIVLATGYHPRPSPLGIAWTAVTAGAMFALAAAKARTGRALGNPILITEGRVTLVDGILALAVLAGLLLNAAAGAWWADPLAALVIVFYTVREAREIFAPAHKSPANARLVNEPLRRSAVMPHRRRATGHQSPGLNGGDGGHNQRGDAVRPPPAQYVVQHESGKSQQARGRSDAAQGAVSFECTA